MASYRSWVVVLPLLSDFITCGMSLEEERVAEKHRVAPRLESHIMFPTTNRPTNRIPCLSFENSQSTEAVYAPPHMFTCI